MNAQQFIQQAQANAKKKAREMAALELSCWNDNHEKELTDVFGFSKKAVKERKAELKNISK